MDDINGGKNQNVEESSINDKNEEINEKNTDSKCDCSEVDALKLAISDFKDKYLRILAEFENYKKRSKKEQIDVSYHIEASLLKEFLGINDDFERALSIDSNNDGLKSIKSRFDEIFKKRGVVKIKTSVGDDFDFNIHEAISSEDTNDKNLDGKIVKVFADAFLFNSKVLRFAKVVIGKYNEKNNEK